MVAPATPIDLIKPEGTKQVGEDMNGVHEPNLLLNASLDGFSHVQWKNLTAAKRGLGA